MKPVRDFLPSMIFNFIEKIHHQITDDEIDFIKKTGLFNHVTEQQFKEMLKSVRLVKYRKEKNIFHEGDLPGAIYIITDGSVRVFTYDLDKQKIPLARLNTGDYFGEQALLGKGSRTRNASIETILDTTLIRISAESIIPLWQNAHDLTLKLKQRGFLQAINTLSLSIKLYGDVKSIMEQIEKNEIIEFQDGETIFNAGDKADNVYFILRGIIKLSISEQHKKRILEIHKGHIFGELGVLEDKPRRGSATAKGHVRLLLIDGEHFKEIYHKNPPMQRLLSRLRKTYQIPMYGIVEQYIGSSSEIGPTLTSVFKLDDGRSIIATRALNQEIFVMSVMNITPTIDYKHVKDPENYTKLYFANQHLVGIESCGEWEDLQTASQMMLGNKKIETTTLEKFALTGEFKIIPKKEVNQIICTCMLVSKSKLEGLINQGMNDFDSLSKATGAGTVCGSCRYKILEMVGENPWLSAVMHKEIQHNSYINSYSIKLNEACKNFIPGQYVIIQAKAGKNWVERAFTISERRAANNFRVTIKKEPQGFFTQWLFKDAPEEFEVNVTQPQGNFTLNPDEDVAAICFAGGIGITPFIIFAKELVAAKSNKKIHILYCALSKADFIFTDEFNALAQINPSLTISYRSTEESGLLSDDEIVNLIKSYPDPDIYICGPEGFMKLVSNTLNHISYPQDKIHIEQFFYAGALPKGSVLG